MAAGMSMRSYHQGRSRPILMVNGDAVTDRQTELLLRLDFEVGRYAGPPHGRPPGMELMPSLFPPPGIRLEGGGGGGGDSHWFTQATAFTDMPVDELARYVADQLLNAGWRQLASTGGSEATCSVWEVPSKDGWRVF